MLKSLEPNERKSRPPPAPPPKEPDANEPAVDAAPPPIPKDARLPDLTPKAPDAKGAPEAASETPKAAPAVAKGLADEEHAAAKSARADLPPVRDPDKTPPADIDQLLADSAAAEDATEAGTSMPTAPPARVDAARAPANSDIAIDVEISGEHTVVEEDDIVLADEVEEVIEAEPAPKPEAPKPKRSLPPPLPRS
jgi:hypothetical protein